MISAIIINMAMLLQTNLGEYLLLLIPLNLTEEVFEAFMSIAIKDGKIV